MVVEKSFFSITARSAVTGAGVRHEKALIKGLNPLRGHHGFTPGEGHKDYKEKIRYMHWHPKALQSP